MIFGEEVEFKDEHINAAFHQYIVLMLHRDPITESSKLDTIGMHCNNINTSKPSFPTDKMRL